jgi:myo-inositol 2-dehydrogenase/D-chiro-inositol 1-dehydrogenase
MKVALIGAGRIGRLHGTLLAGQPAVDQVIVGDVDPEHASSTALAIGGTTAASPEAAMDAADAVVIAASTKAHAALVGAALDRGLPIFCEKPLAFDLPESIELTERIEAAGAVVQVGFQRRFEPSFVEARRLVASGDLGTVYLVRLIAHDHDAPPEAYLATSGGLWRDSSIHDFDALRWLTGQEVVEVYAAGAVRGFPFFERYDDIDTGAAILQLGDGTLGVLSQTRHDPRGYDVRMEIVGSKDAVTVGLGPRTPLRSLEPAATEFGHQGWDSFLSRFEAAYREELVTFLRVAHGDFPSPCTARDSLEAIRIAIAAGRSREEHRPVRLADIEEAHEPQNARR